MGENVFNGYPCKNITKYFCIFFHFRTFCFCFSFLEKTPILVVACGICPPPPFTDWSVTYRFFLTPSLNYFTFNIIFCDLEGLFIFQNYQKTGPVYKKTVPVLNKQALIVKRPVQFRTPQYAS